MLYEDFPYHLHIYLVLLFIKIFGNMYSKYLVNILIQGKHFQSWIDRRKPRLCYRARSQVLKPVEL